MEKCGTSSGSTTKKVTVHSCGEEGVDDQPAKKQKGSGEEVQVLHIIRKHHASRRPSSWRQEKITCSKLEAASFLQDLRGTLEKPLDWAQGRRAPQVRRRRTERGLRKAGAAAFGLRLRQEGR